MCERTKEDYMARVDHSIKAPLLTGGQGSPQSVEEPLRVCQHYIQECGDRERGALCDVWVHNQIIHRIAEEELVEILHFDIDSDFETDKTQSRREFAWVEPSNWTVVSSTRPPMLSKAMKPPRFLGVSPGSPK
jgi:hypothetical protein